MFKQSAAGLENWTAFQHICDLLSFGESHQLHDIASWNWEQIVKIASTRLVASVLAKPVQAQINAPEEVKQYFNAILEMSRNRSKIQLDGLSAIVGKLQKRGINPILLKGAASVVSDTYAEPALRFMGDVDILISPEERMLTKAVFAEAGYIDRPGDEPRRAGVFYNEEAMVHPETELGFDIHVALGRFSYRKFLDSAGFINRASQHEFEERIYLTPCVNDRIIHCIFHERIQHGNQARGGVDLRQLVELRSIIERNKPNIDWSLIQNHFHKNGQGAALTTMLSLLKICLHYETPLGAIESVSVIEQLKMWLDPTVNNSSAKIFFRTMKEYTMIAVQEPVRLIHILRPKMWSNRYRILRNRLSKN
jgi:Uncharacterised nucleotidyltransferase